MGISSCGVFMGKLEKDKLEGLADAIAEALGIDVKTRDELKEKARARAVRVLEESKEDIDFEEVFTQLEELTGKLDVDEATRKKIIELTKEGSERVAEYFKKKSEEKKECSGECGCKGCNCKEKMVQAVKNVLYDGYDCSATRCVSHTKVANKIIECIEDINESFYPGLIYRDVSDLIKLLEKTPRYFHAYDMAFDRTDFLKVQLPKVLFDTDSMQGMVSRTDEVAYAELWVKLIFNYAMNFDAVMECKEPKVNIHHGIDDLTMLLAFGPENHMLLNLLNCTFKSKFGSVSEYKELDIEEKADAIQQCLEEILPKLSKNNKAFIMEMLCSGSEPYMKFVTFYMPVFVRTILLESETVEGNQLSEVMIDAVRESLDGKKKCSCGGCNCKK